MVPHGNLIISSTWIVDPRYGYYEVRFGGTAKVLQRYFAVAKIVILLCIHKAMHVKIDLTSQTISP